MQVCSEYWTVLQDENTYMVEWTGDAPLLNLLQLVQLPRIEEVTYHTHCGATVDGSSIQERQKCMTCFCIAVPL